MKLSEKLKIYIDEAEAAKLELAATKRQVGTLVQILEAVQKTLADQQNWRAPELARETIDVAHATVTAAIATAKGETND